MVFFQTVLLLGYAYTHLSTSLLGVRRQAAIHLVVIFCRCWCCRFFRRRSRPAAHQDPSLWLLVQLTLVVGLPFFVVSTTAPLLQRWFINTGHAGRAILISFIPSAMPAVFGAIELSVSHRAENGPAYTNPRLDGGLVLLVVLLICCALVMWIASRRAAAGCRPASPMIRGMSELEKDSRRSAAEPAFPGND